MMNSKRTTDADKKEEIFLNTQIYNRFSPYYDRKHADSLWSLHE